MPLVVNDQIELIGGGKAVIRFIGKTALNDTIWHGIEYLSKLSVSKPTLVTINDIKSSKKNKNTTNNRSGIKQHKHKKSTKKASEIITNGYNHKNKQKKTTKNDIKIRKNCRKLDKKNKESKSNKNHLILENIVNEALLKKKSNRMKPRSSSAPSSHIKQHLPLQSIKKYDVNNTFAINIDLTDIDYTNIKNKTNISKKHVNNITNNANNKHKNIINKSQTSTTNIIDIAALIENDEDEDEDIEDDIDNQQQQCPQIFLSVKTKELRRKSAPDVEPMDKNNTNKSDDILLSSKKQQNKNKNKNKNSVNIKSKSHKNIQIRSKKNSKSLTLKLRKNKPKLRHSLSVDSNNYKDLEKEKKVSKIKKNKKIQNRNSMIYGMYSYSKDLFKNRIVIGNRYLLKDGRYGVCRYYGIIDKRKKQKYIGIELEIGNGENNGIINNKKYFKCNNKNMGVFIMTKDIKKDLGKSV